MTRVSGVDDNFINKPRLVQDETIRRTRTDKHCCGDRKKWYGGYHGRPKSGPALAGPAAPATTALRSGAATDSVTNNTKHFILSFIVLFKS